MVLSNEDVLKKIINPDSKGFLSIAIVQEERLQMHCEPILEKYNLPYNAYREFTIWWQSLIPQEKWNRVNQMIRTPVSTLAVTQKIHDQQKKFIDAQDRYVDFRFTNPDFTNDYNDYLASINDDSFWKQKCVEALKSQICSYVVIDLAQIQTSERPAPYKYFVSPRNVIDVKINQYTGAVEYFLFKESDFYWSDSMFGTNARPQFALVRDGNLMNKIIAIDDKSYRVYAKKDKDKDFNLLFESVHDLGYCPVIDFWQPSTRGSNGINKVGVMTVILGKLDYYMLFHALSDYMRMSAPFPVLTMYDIEAAYLDNKADVQPNTGQNFATPDFSPVSNVIPSQDPKESNQKLIAPGTVIKLPIPDSSSEHDLMKNPMRYLEMDVKTLEHVENLVKKLEDEIIEIATGEDDDYLNEIAKNPEMLFASFESKDSILTWIKKQVERVHRFCTKATCELRYGKEYFISCTIDYGSEYFLKDSTILTREFKSAVESGMPQGYCIEIARTAINTRFKNNTENLARARILYELEPYPVLSFEQIQLLEINKTDVLNFKIKANFAMFISMFELANGSIVRFGERIPYDKKIAIIKNQLIEYANNTKWTNPDIAIGAPQGS